MCLLLVLHRVLPRYPVIVAANRDESYERRSLPPEILPARGGDEPRVLAPRDALHGGTWIGVNAAGLFVGLTNRPPGTPDPSRRSRGLLALDVLRQRDANAADAFLEGHLRATTYNPFNLLWSDGRRARVVHVDKEIRREELQPGVHVLSNLDDVNRIYVTEILRAFDPIGAARRMAPRALLAHLQGICRNHDVRTSRGHAVCKHYDTRGTVSSSILMLRRDGGPGETLLHAPGPPCRTPYEDLSSLLARLRAPGSRASA